MSSARPPGTSVVLLTHTYQVIEQNLSVEGAESLGGSAREVIRISISRVGGCIDIDRGNCTDAV